MCDALHWVVTPEQFEKVKLIFTVNGYRMLTDRGSTEYQEIGLEWSYVKTDNGGELSIRCIKKPTQIPCTTVNIKIRDFVSECLKPETTTLP